MTDKLFQTAGNDDDDWLNNIGEFGLGGDPTDPSDTGFAPELSMLEADGTTWVYFTYPQRSDPNSGIQYTVEGSDSLAEESWAATAYELVATNPDGYAPDLDAITIRIPTTGKSRKFFRVLIESEGE